MKPLELYTLLYVIGAISLLFAFLMLLFHKLTPAIKGPFEWALGSFSAVLGALLFAGYPSLPGYVAFVVSALFSVLAISFYMAGIQLFVGKKINFRYFYGLVGAEFILSHFFYLVIPLPQWRMISFSFVCLFGTLVVVAELLKQAKGRYRLAFILCSVVFSISAVTSLFRIVAIVIWKPEEAHTPLFANLLFYLLTNVTQALLMFAFLLLISVKIAEQIEQKVEDQRKFYSIISHDLNGPVGTINVMLNMANEDLNLENKQKLQMYIEAEKLSLSTHHLLQNLLFWSRSQLEDLKPHSVKFDLNKVIVENIDLMRQISKSKNVNIVYLQPENDLYCYADERMIHTVLRNLISNSIKFSHSGGTINISVEKAEMLTVEISDNGVGMSDEVLDRLFTSNEKVSSTGTYGEKGSGLGLSICKEFVDLNKGSLEIKSKKNEGTEVTVLLPVG